MEGTQDKTHRPLSVIMGFDSHWGHSTVRMSKYKCVELEVTQNSAQNLGSTF